MSCKAAVQRLLWDVLLIKRSPDRSIRQAWDVLQLVNVAMHVTVVPFCVSYLQDLDIRQVSGLSGVVPWETMALVMDIVYLLDMAMQTRCAHDSVTVESQSALQGIP